MTEVPSQDPTRSPRTPGPARRRRWPRRVAATSLSIVVLLAVVAGLTVALGLGRHACSKVGCVSAIVIDVNALEGVGDLTAISVHVCVHGRGCRDDVASARDSVIPGSLVVVSDAAGSTLTIDDLVLSTAEGVTLFEAHGPTKARAARSQPNGSGCAPTCWTARFAAGDGHSLEPVAP